MAMFRYLVGVGLITGLLGVTHAQNLAGPPRPSDTYECTRFYEPVFAQLSRDLRDWEQGNCATIPDKAGRNHPAYKACYERLTMMRRTQHQQILDGRSACFQRASDFQQQEAERHRREAVAARQAAQNQKITVIPVPQTTRSSPQRNEVSQQQINDASQAVGALLSSIFRDKVEKEVGAGTANPVSAAVEQNNERAFKLFEEARDSFQTHSVVKAFQDMAWTQLQNQMQVVTQQLSNLDLQISTILEKSPTWSAAVQVPDSREVEVVLRGEEEKSEYTGQLDSSGRPHGLGIATKKDKGGERVSYSGPFEHGAFHGYGVHREHVGQGAGRALLEIKGRYDNGAPVGPSVFSYINVATGKVDVYHFIKEGEIEKPLRVQYADGTKFAGDFENLQPAASGLWTDRDGSQTLMMSDGRSLITRPNGQKIRCEKSYRAYDGKSTVCTGVRFIEHVNGAKTVEFMKNSSVPALPDSMIYMPATGDRAGYVETCKSPLVAEARVCKRVWSSGGSYEGEWNSKGWGEGTVGIYTHVSGAVEAGRFEGRKLVDGVVTRADGTRVPVGAGTNYSVPRVASLK